MDASTLPWLGFFFRGGCLCGIAFLGFWVPNELPRELDFAVYTWGHIHI